MSEQLSYGNVRYEAKNANDGNSGGTLDDTKIPGCAVATATGGNGQFWAADMGITRRIKKVVVKPRLDCGGNCQSTVYLVSIGDNPDPW